MCVSMGKRKRDRLFSEGRKKQTVPPGWETSASRAIPPEKKCMELCYCYYYNYDTTTATTTTTRPYISSIVYTGWHWWPSTPSAFMDWPWHCKQSIYSGSHWKICLSSFSAGAALLYFVRFVYSPGVYIYTKTWIALYPKIKSNKNRSYRQTPFKGSQRNASWSSSSAFYMIQFPFLFLLFIYYYYYFFLRFHELAIPARS